MRARYPRQTSLAAWRRHGGGMAAAWRRHGGSMAAAWRLRLLASEPVNPPLSSTAKMALIKARHVQLQRGAAARRPCVTLHIL